MDIDHIIKALKLIKSAGLNVPLTGNPLVGGVINGACGLNKDCIVQVNEPKESDNNSTNLAAGLISSQPVRVWENTEK